MLTVAIASGDPTSSAQLWAVLQQTGMVGSIKQWTIPTEKVPDSAETLPDVVLLDLSRDPDAHFAFAVQLRRIRATVKVVACSSLVPPTPQLLLGAMRSGVQDFLSKPVQPDALKEMLLRFVQEGELRDRPSLDKLIVVMGSKGGVGATTVAVNLGVQLSAFAHKHVALLDFARPLGNVHLLLDLQPHFGIRDAMDNLDRLDSHFFAGLLSHHSSNLEVLGGASHPEAWQSIPIAQLERVVNVAQNSFDLVLADIGSDFSSEWSAVLRMARMILVVTEANVPSLWNLERRLVALTGLGINPDRTRIIVNRWHKGDDDTLKSIQKDIRRPIFACVPNDFRKANEAVNLGTPLMQNHNNELSSRYREIAGLLTGMDARRADKKSFFSFSTKR